MGAYDIPLVIQDKQFNDDGDAPLPIRAGEHRRPWLGEYFGDCMLVNGRIWPSWSSSRPMYRFRLLNGSNARILESQDRGRRQCT